MNLSHFTNDNWSRCNRLTFSKETSCPQLMCRRRSGAGSLGKVAFQMEATSTSTEEGTTRHFVSATKIVGWYIVPLFNETGIVKSKKSLMIFCMIGFRNTASVAEEASLLQQRFNVPRAQHRRVRTSPSHDIASLRLYSRSGPAGGLLSLHADGNGDGNGNRTIGSRSDNRYSLRIYLLWRRMTTQESYRSNHFRQR